MPLFPSLLLYSNYANWIKVQFSFNILLWYVTITYIVLGITYFHEYVTELLSYSAFGWQPITKLHFTSYLNLILLKSICTQMHLNVYSANLKILEFWIFAPKFKDIKFSNIYMQIGYILGSCWYGKPHSTITLWDRKGSWGMMMYLASAGLKGLYEFRSWCIG